MELINDLIRELIIYGIEFLILLFVFNAFFKVKAKPKLVYGLIGIVYAVIIAIGEYSYLEVRNIVYYFYIFSICFYLFSGRLRLKIGVLFLGLCLDLIVEEALIVLLSLVLKKDYIFVSESKILSQVVVQYIKLIILIMLSKICIPYINKKSKAKRYMGSLGGIVTTLFIIIPIASYVVLAIFLETFCIHLSKSEALIMEGAVICCLFGFNVLIILLINKVIANKEYEYSNNMIRKQITIQFNHYKYLERINKETRSLKHDMKNHIICVQSLLKNGKNQEAMEYIEKVTKRIKQLDDKISTGDTIIDAILQEKCGRAEEQNIRLTVKGKFVASLQMDAMDKCTLLTNAIDNAIEYCMKIEEVSKRKVEVEISYNKEYMFLSVKNPILEKVNMIDGKIKTTKENQRYHGFGIENMKDVANRYGAYLSIGSENEQFNVELMIRMNTLGA